MIQAQAMRIVIDTNVLVAASRSRIGASFRLISAIPSPFFQICLSVALYLEWEEVLTRPENLPPGQSAQDAAAFLRYLLDQSHLQEIHYLWRPLLADPDDDMVLELAVAAGCRFIVTHNIRDYAGVATMGVTPLTPADFIDRIGLRS